MGAPFGPKRPVNSGLAAIARMAAAVLDRVQMRVAGWLFTCGNRMQVDVAWLFRAKMHPAAYRFSASDQVACHSELPRRDAGRATLAVQFGLRGKLFLDIIATSSGRIIRLGKRSRVLPGCLFETRSPRCVGFVRKLHPETLA